MEWADNPKGRCQIRNFFVKYWRILTGCFYRSEIDFPPDFGDNRGTFRNEFSFLSSKKFLMVGWWPGSGQISIETGSMKVDIGKGRCVLWPVYLLYSFWLQWQTEGMEKFLTGRFYWEFARELPGSGRIFGGLLHLRPGFSEPVRRSMLSSGSGCWGPVISSWWRLAVWCLAGKPQ